jgi:prophage regulatory protein
MTEAIRMIRRPEVERLTGLRRSTIYELMARGQFPRPVALGRKAVAWLESEVAEWQRQRIAQRDEPTK